MYNIVTARRLRVLLCSSRALSKSPPSIPIRRGLNSCIASYVIAFGPIVSSRRVIHANWSERNYVITIMFYLPEHIVKTSRTRITTRGGLTCILVLSATCMLVPRRVSHARIVPRFGCTARAGYRESIRNAHCSPPAKRLSVRIVVSAVFRPRFQRESHDSSTNASRTTAVVAARAVFGGGGGRGERSLNTCTWRRAFSHEFPVPVYKDWPERPLA